MADYSELLRRAMAEGRPNGAARREIYAQARVALLKSLRGSSGISPREITTQRLRLEESIREVEREENAPEMAPTGDNTSL